MDLKDYLTNEKLSKKFNNQFELVNYAIRLAGNMIMTGRESRVKVDSQNRSMQVLSEILNDKDQFDEIVVEKIEQSATETDIIQEAIVQTGKGQAKSTERKKSRVAKI